jgi:hypothetical protein
LHKQLLLAQQQQDKTLRTQAVLQEKSQQALLLLQRLSHSQLWAASGHIPATAAKVLLVLLQQQTAGACRNSH